MATEKEQTASSPTATDPITTEVIRHALEAQADHMKVALRRAAFSPVIYEMFDFACGLYDREIRLLAQAHALPLFLGTLGFCVEAATAAVGGEEALEPGDVIFTTYGYDIGSHQQDLAVVVPAFLEGELIGYAVNKAHQLDIGAKEPYCTDTVDIFQEGVIFPGVKLYSGGVLNSDIYRTLLANSRLPTELAGDLNAQIGSAEIGAAGLATLVGRYGRDLFAAAVDRMFDHGEAIVRELVGKIADGRYVAQGAIDDNGVSDELLPFEIAVEIEGSEMTVDFTASPDEQPGPINCPLPTTVSATRCAIMSLVGGSSANEGHFRPIAVRTRPGTLFHPEPPAPIFLFGWPAIQAVDVIHRALADVLPAHIPAGSGGDICSFMIWGHDADNALWVTGADHTVGQGGGPRDDGGAPLIHIATSGERNTPVEVWESRYPFFVERLELAPDSGGPGEFRGGLGIDMDYRTLADVYVTSNLERTRTRPWGLAGGGPGRANSWSVRNPDGSTHEYRKVTGLHLPPSSVICLRSGGGGGYGPPLRRDPDLVESDVEEGYLSRAAASRDYGERVGQAKQEV
jgi:N-methylhydantoinase B